ncbi:AMP-binding protein [Corynebacterium bovis]|uniref:AMP-binding protein n=1 Tax=Corynebacterium bovis TaxID=36808 RepID=UPI003138EB16
MDFSHAPRPVAAALAVAREKTVGLVQCLRHGVVGVTEGVAPWRDVVPQLIRYGFSTARQLEYAADCCPDQDAFRDDDGSRTFLEARDDVRALARSLVSRGHGPGSRVAVMARNGRGILYPLAAKGHVGYRLYLFNVGSSGRQLAASLIEHDIDALFIDAEFADRVPDSPPCDVYLGWTPDGGPLEDRDWPVMSAMIASAPQATSLPFRPPAQPLVLMSSGTTGTPKGVVMHEPFAPFGLIGSILSAGPWRSHMLIQQTASMFHIWGWALVNLSWATRSTIVTQRIFDPRVVMETIEREGITAVMSSAVFLKGMVDLPDADDFHVSSVEFVSNAGNAMSEDLVRRLQRMFGPVLSSFYGSTEVTAVAVASREDLLEAPTAAGYPPLGTTTKVLDENGVEVPQGTVGLIHARNAQTLSGYANPRDADQLVERQGLVDLGDRGYIDENGRLHVLGRSNDMIIVGGENIYPASVIECLSGMPGVHDVYCKGVADDAAFQRIAAWVVREDSAAGRELTAEAVRDWVTAGLQEAAAPRDVHWVDELPRNATGKVIARELPGATTA